MDSRPFLASTFFLSLSSSSLYFSASWTIFSISSLESLPLSLVIVIFSVFPEALSWAETLRIPLASISKVTSICVVLLGWDGRVTWDEDGHDLSGGLDTLGEGGDIEEEEVLDLLAAFAGENGGLDGGTVGDGFIWVDGSVELLSVEEVLEHGLDLWNTGGTSNEDDFVDLSLSDVGILEDGLDGWHALAEVWEAELLELGTGDSGVEVFTIGEGLTVDLGLMGGGEDSLGLLALGSESSHGSGVVGDVDAGGLLELGHAVVDEDVVEVLTTKMGVTVGSLDFENTFLDGEEGDIEGSTTEIEDEDVALTLVLLVKTVGDGGSGWLVDDSLNVES